MEEGRDTAVIVLLRDGGLSDLITIYFNALEITSSTELER